MLTGHYQEGVQSQIFISGRATGVVMDKFGVDSEEAREIGTQAFLQACHFSLQQPLLVLTLAFKVDHPYFRRTLQRHLSDKIAAMGKPHWVNTQGSKIKYKSQKALGRLWDLAEENIHTILGRQYSSKTGKGTDLQADPQIMKVVQDEISRRLIGSQDLCELCVKFKKATLDYVSCLGQQVRSIEGDPQDERRDEVS